MRAFSVLSTPRGWLKLLAPTSVLHLLSFCLMCFFNVWVSKMRITNRCTSTFGRLLLPFRPSRCADANHDDGAYKHRLRTRFYRAILKEGAFQARRRVLGARKYSLWPSRKFRTAGRSKPFALLSLNSTFSTRDSFQGLGRLVR
jgi:hypothetical protein